MSVRKTILSVLAEYGVDVRHEGSVLRALCPFHDDKGRPNFTIYENTNSWYCWACKESGDVIAFVAKMEGITYGQAKSKIEGVGVDLTELREKIDGVGIEDEPLPVNANLNILVSRLVRDFVRQHPDKTGSLLSILKDFDLRILQPVNPIEIEAILTNLKQKLLSI